MYSKTQNDSEMYDKLKQLVFEYLLAQKYNKAIFVIEDSDFTDFIPYILKKNEYTEH